jgi:hypothetical protein
MEKPDAFELTPAQIQRFEATDFERQPPGTILRDFETLLNLIGDSGMPATPARGIALGSLETINRSLAHPLDLRLKRPVQKSYPAINGLYLLLRATGLGRIDTRRKKTVLTLDPDILQSWQSLNAAERYFALLKAWWGRATEEMLGERRTWQADFLLRNIHFLTQIPESGIMVYPTPQDADGLRYHPGLYNVALMELFGFMEVRTLPPELGKGWLPKELRMTDWGWAVMGGYLDYCRKNLFAETELPELWLDSFGSPMEALQRFDRWSQFVRPHIRGWRQELKVPEPVFQPGPHLFKVSLGAGCWRRIAAPGESFLDGFASTILDAFDFDNDHLYRFSYKDPFGRTIEIDHPYMGGDSENPVSDEFKVGEIPLSEGMHIEFLFDFGDNWKFDIEVERVNAELSVEKPEVLETHGEAPPQYPSEENW